MPRKPKKSSVKKFVDADPEVIYYIKLVDIVRRSSNPVEVNDAFRLISEGLDQKIKKVASRFKIPGHSRDDIYQECLCALRWKAIKDYDVERGTEPGKPARFDRFALICVRRHLATTLKTAYQNRHRIQNESKSLDQDRGKSNDELSLVNLVCGQDGNVLGDIERKEFFKVFISKLMSHLSIFEKQVFYLYAQQHTYEEIAKMINAKQKTRIKIKSIDNALSRIKAKVWELAERLQGQYAEELKQYMKGKGL